MNCTISVYHLRVMTFYWINQKCPLEKVFQGSLTDQWAL